MPWAVLNKSYQIFTGIIFTSTQFFVQFSADETDNVDIAPFIGSANVEYFSGSAFMENKIQSFTVVFYKQPIADIFSVSINWNGKFLCAVMDQ